MLLLLFLIITLVYSMIMFNNKKNFRKITFKKQNQNSVFQIINNNGHFRK